MLRKTLLVSAGTIALVSQAFAADLPSSAPPPVYVPPVPIFTWTGFYLGAQVGYAWGSQSANFAFPNGTVLASHSSEGVIGGAHVGYNYQANQWVLGVEGTVDGTSLSKSINPVFAGVGYSTSVPIQGSIRGRLGVAWDRVLLYATGGAAFAGFDTDFTGAFGTVSQSTTRVGWTVGGGLEYAVTNNWSIRAEYRYSDFGSYTTNPTLLVGPTTVNRDFTQHQVQGGITYHFSPPPAPVVAKY